MTKQLDSTDSSLKITSPRVSFTERFIYAATKGYLEDVTALLEQGVNVNMKDELGNTALRNFFRFLFKINANCRFNQSSFAFIHSSAYRYGCSRWSR
jgi:hypothetical protein